MGKFVAKAWRDDSGKEYAFCMCWGTLVRDAELRHNKKSKAQATVKWARGQFLNIEAWGDDPSYAVLASLEKGEEVIVFGTHYRFDYQTRDGERKEGYALKAEIVLPMTLIQYLVRLFGSKGIQAIVQADEGADPMESAPAEEENAYDPFAQPGSAGEYYDPFAGENADYNPLA